MGESFYARFSFRFYNRLALLRHWRPVNECVAATLEDDMDHHTKRRRRIRKMLLLPFIVLTTVLAAQARLPSLDLGAPAPSTSVKTDHLLLVAAAQLMPKRLWKFDGVEYFLGVDDTGLVQYIGTTSTMVSTPEGVYVGQTFADLIRKDHVRVSLWRGRGFVAELPSGWKAFLFLDGESWERAPGPSDRVDQLFKGTQAGYGAGHSKR